MMGEIAVDNNHYYNAIVNVTTDHGLNAKNFLESLRFKDSGRALIGIIRDLEQRFACQATVYGSFKGSAVLESGVCLLAGEQEKYMESVMLRFSEYDNLELSQHLAAEDPVRDSLSEIVYFGEWDSFVISLRTERFLSANPGHGECSFRVGEARDEEGKAY